MTDVSAGRAPARTEANFGSPAALLRALQAGDEKAFARIVQVWSPTLVRTALALTGDHSRAEALVRDTWLLLLTEVSAFRPPPRLHAWVCGLMLRESGVNADAPGDHPMSPAVQPGRFLPPSDPEWPGHWALPPTSWPALEDGRPDRGVGSALREALDQLPDPERVVVGLRDVAGCEVTEIGEIVGRPVDQVRALLNHGRAAVRTRLESHLAAAQPA